MNLGNTCYMNAALQCVIHTPQLVASFINKQFDKEIKSNAKCSRELYDLIRSSVDNTSSYGVEKPSGIKSQMGKKYSQFSGVGQQDSCEFLLELLELLTKELNRVTTKEPYKMLNQTNEPLKKQSDVWYEYNMKRNNSIITDIFQGQTFNSVICSKCGYQHISFDNFLSLSLNIPKSTIRISHACQLKSCFDEFIREEKMNSNEGFICNKCKKPVDIVKRNVIWRYPPVLIIHLKRFFCSTWRKEKLDTSIEIPLEIDLKNYKAESSN